MTQTTTATTQERAQVIAARFTAHCLEKGLDLDLFEDGYDPEDGRLYGEIVTNFLNALDPEQPWVVLMHWTSDHSNLVAERTIAESGEVTTIERVNLSHPLDGDLGDDQDHEDSAASHVVSFAHSVVLLQDLKHVADHPEEDPDAE